MAFILDMSALLKPQNKYILYVVTNSLNSLNPYFPPLFVEYSPFVNMKKTWRIFDCSPTPQKDFFFCSSVRHVNCLSVKAMSKKLKICLPGTVGLLYITVYVCFNLAR